MPAPDNRTFLYQRGAKSRFCNSSFLHLTKLPLHLQSYQVVTGTGMIMQMALCNFSDWSTTTFTWQTNSVVLPFWLADLGSAHYLQLCPDFFHCHCFCGTPPFKTAQLSIVSERMSSACGIFCPSRPSELGSKQSTFHTGYVSLNAHQDPFLDSA